MFCAMIFHIQHSHDEATCPFDTPEAVGSTFGAVLPRSRSTGLSTFLGRGLTRLVTSSSLSWKTDDYDALVAGLAPIVSSGTATISAGE